jgi:hypothetical protein
MNQFVTGIQERELLATKTEYFLSNYDTLTETLGLSIIEDEPIAPQENSRIYFSSQQECAKFISDNWKFFANEELKWDTGFDGRWFLEY